MLLARVAERAREAITTRRRFARAAVCWEDRRLGKVSSQAVELTHADGLGNVSS